MKTKIKKFAKGATALGLLRANKLTDDEAAQLYVDIEDLMFLCDELDGEDAFGTEGWRHRIGWDR